ncbi:MAG: hypothetical protein HC860_12175 [Alkalinema sp. RU_4_3]|nr:hypothetical protein [Alkalinema sp. RU_4_3]
MSRILSTLWLSSFFTIAAFLLLMPAARSQLTSPMVSPGLSDVPERGETLKWIPIARVDPALETEIKLTNRTREPLEFLITTHTDFRTLQPGETVKLLNTELPMFLNVNAKRSVPLAYSVKVEGKRRIVVDVAFSSSSQNDTTLNVDTTGAIYLY